MRWNIAVVAMINVAVGAIASGQDFRMESNTYNRDESKPFAESLTLFDNDVVYDFQLNGDKEITVFHFESGRIIALNPTKRTKQVFSMGDMRAKLTEIRQSGLTGAYPFFFDPKFDAEYDREDNTLTMSSEQLTYEVTGLEVDRNREAAIGKYQHFADWAARHTALHFKGMPPYSRVLVNRELADHGLLPKEVRLEIGSRRLRSTHTVTWLLSKTDRKRINQVHEAIAEFEEK